MVDAVYSTHTASKEITRAFASGSKAKWIPVEEYQDGPIAIYGLARGLLRVNQTAKRGGHDRYIIDHGYLNAGHFSGYYSVTKNARQHTGVGDYDAKRLDPIRPEMSPMRTGKHILLLPPSRAFAELSDIDTDEWIAQYKNLETDRPIIVREKPTKHDKPKTKLEEDFKDCHAVVTYHSKAAIKAAIAGISVFGTHDCCVSGISGDLSTIDSPSLDIDRESWLRALSYNQYTLGEMRKWDLVTTS